MATAIVSAARGEPVRSDVAMTGEITLSGLVLPVGGIREKALAARRYGIKTFILPEMNEQDLAELPAGGPRGHDVRAGAHARGRAQGRAARGARRRRAGRADRRAVGFLLHFGARLRTHGPPDRRSSTRSGARSAGTRRSGRRTSAPRRLFDQTARVPITFLEAAERHRRRSDRQRAPRRARNRRARCRVLSKRFPLGRPRKRHYCARKTRDSSSPTPLRWRARPPPLPTSPRSSLSNFTWDWIYEGYDAELARRA